jgi:NADH-quinone oxidoreductase subunit I
MSLLKDIWSAVSGIGKGMEKTYDEQFDPIFTEMYPFDMPKLPPTSVQSLALIKNEDGSDRCVSCLACEKVCPSQVITIERKKNPAGKGFVLERFDIDLVNCMYCAACVESCPASAIVTIQDFEMSTPNLQTLKADKDFLDFQGIRAQQWYSPKIGVEYRENVSASNIHGSIVKAPLMDQPGGAAEYEKLKAAGTEIPVNNARRPANAMSELSVLEYKHLKHEPISAPAQKLENTAPVAVKIPVVIPASALETVAATAPATPSAPKSKKIKRWGEPASEDSSQPVVAEVAPAVAPNPLNEGVAEGGGSSPAEAAIPKAEAVVVAPASSLEPVAPVASSPEAPAEEKPRNPKIKRWEPKS